MRVASAGMTLLFTVWAYYQLNDLDPFIWVTVYSIAALISLLFLFGRMASWLPLTMAVLCILCAVYLFTQADYGPPLITIEEWREAVGLLVIAAWMSTLLFYLGRGSSLSTQSK